MSAIPSIPPASGIPSEPSSLTLAQRGRLWESAKALEANFTRYLLSQMGTETPGLKSMAGGPIFADMFREALATTIADSQSLGLAHVAYLQLSHLAAQEKSTPHENTPGAGNDPSPH